jgi:hypothetical protein
MASSPRPSPPVEEREKTCRLRAFCCLDVTNNGFFQKEKKLDGNGKK